MDASGGTAPQKPSAKRVANADDGAANRLVPPEERLRDVREVIAELLQFQKEHTLGGITIREFIDEGRRY